VAHTAPAPPGLWVPHSGAGGPYNYLQHPYRGCPTLAGFARVGRDTLHEIRLALPLYIFPQIILLPINFSLDKFLFP
jgi:hypothetical protein